MSTRTMKTAASTTISKEKSKTDMFLIGDGGLGQAFYPKKKEKKVGGFVIQGKARGLGWLKL